MPPKPLAAMGSLLPGTGRKMIWLHFVRRFAFWRSVRSHVDRRFWRELTVEDVRSGRRDRASPQRAVSAAPQYGLAVLIASHHRRERLRRCLDALAAQTLDPGDFEVIVADDGSSDGTAAAVETYADRRRFGCVPAAGEGRQAGGAE